MVTLVRDWSEFLRRLGKRLVSKPVHAVVAALTALCVFLGVALRSRGNSTPLWLDEATWAVFLLENPITDQLIRPIGFMALSKWLAGALSPSEVVLRLLPWAAGVLTALVSPLLARRMFVAPSARLLFVAAMCLHAVAIDFSKEFKPYSVSLFFHVGLLLVAFNYVTVRSNAALCLALGVATLGTLFAQDVVFAYPGFFLVLFFKAVRERRPTHLRAIVGGAALVLGIVAAHYVFIWSHAGDDSAAPYWGDKYGVFFTEKYDGSFADWWLHKYVEMTGYPGVRRMDWRSAAFSREEVRALAATDARIWFLLHGAGLFVLIWRRRFDHLLLLVMPLVVMTGLNWLGYWPFGVFRTNLFIAVYFTAIACAGFDLHADRHRQWAAPIPALLLVAAPLCAFEKNWHERKTALAVHSEFPAVLERLIDAQNADEGQRDVLVLERRTCTPWTYYTQYHPVYSREFGSVLERHFDARCAETNQAFLRSLRGVLKSRDERAWVLGPRWWLVENMRRGPLKRFRASRKAVTSTEVGLRLQRR